MKAILLAIMSLFSAWQQPEPVKFEVEGRFQASQDRIDSCNKAIEEFATQYTDLWYEQMEQCVYLDADYLDVPFQPEGETQ